MNYLYVHAQSISCPTLLLGIWTVTWQAPLSVWDYPGKNTVLGSHFLLQRTTDISTTDRNTICGIKTDFTK